MGAWLLTAVFVTPRRKVQLCEKLQTTGMQEAEALYWHSGLFVMVAQFAFFLLFIAFEKPA